MLCSDGLAVITCHDLQSVCALAAEDKQIGKDGEYDIFQGAFSTPDVILRAVGQD